MDGDCNDIALPSGFQLEYLEWYKRCLNLVHFTDLVEEISPAWVLEQDLEMFPPDAENLWRNEQSLSFYNHNSISNFTPATFTKDDSLIEPLIRISLWSSTVCEMWMRSP